MIARLLGSQLAAFRSRSSLRIECLVKASKYVDDFLPVVLDLAFFILYARQPLLLLIVFDDSNFLGIFSICF